MLHSYLFATKRISQISQTYLHFTWDAKVNYYIHAHTVLHNLGKMIRTLKADRSKQSRHLTKIIYQTE